MNALLREAHRRHVWRTLGIFVGSGWVVLQVIDLFIERGFVPEWVFTGALAVLVLGLPVMLATAWVQGGGSEWVDAGDGEETESELAELLTWKRAVLGGVLAFALLGLATSVYMGMRVLGIGAPATLAAQGVFEEGGRIVLADFESSAGDAAPGELVTEALRIDLAQSSAFELVGPATVASTLVLMRRDPADGLTRDIARDVAVREGVQAVVSGEVGRLGDAFVITARVVAAESGDVLASFRVTADSEAELIGAIDELSRDMRSKIGESLRSVARSESLPAVTTSSLEALRKYTAVANRLDRGLMTPPAAQQLLLEAVQLDSTFASAYRALSIAINNYGGDRETGAWAAVAAYRHRDRLPERERLASEAYYHSTVSGDVRLSAQAYRAMLERDPTNRAAGVNLADREMYAGNYQEAVRVLRLNPGWEIGPWTFNLTAALSGAGRLQEALAARDTVEAHSPSDPYLVAVRALLLSVNGRLGEAWAVLDGAPPNRGVAAAVEAQARAVNRILRGQLDAARSELEMSLTLAGEHGTRAQQLGLGLVGPLATAWSGGDPARAEREVDELLDRIGWETMSAYNRGESMVAFVFALSGRPERAAAMLARYDAQTLPYPDPQARAVAEITRALLDLRSQGTAALPALEEAVGLYKCARCRDLFLGYGFELTGRSADAIAAYERYLAHPFFDGSDATTQIFASVLHERLGTLYEDVDDPVRAAEHYARFAELWADAEPGLQSRVARARDRAAALGGGG